MTQAHRRGVPLVVSAPSGAGKTTLCRRVMAELTGVEFSVSHTTRPPRANERDGVDYHFVSDAEFDRLVEAGAFLEWAHVHDHRYGTAKVEADTRLPRGIDVLFDIDVQGGRQIAQRVKDAVLVFVLPPDMASLEARLTGRGSDGPDVIARRLQKARQELAQASFYTHFIVNDVLERAVDELRSIVIAERLR
ncbi:MAG: guanylate kinase, partial [Deltaproteobacteria bacterium]|nr:guanylate kinase [Deltaproteobacteria bacterium]